MGFRMMASPLTGWSSGVDRDKLKRSRIVHTPAWKQGYANLTRGLRDGLAHGSGGQTNRGTDVDGDSCVSYKAKSLSVK